MKIHFQPSCRLTLVFLLTCGVNLSAVFATHNRAGEILVEQIGPLTVRATVITYTKASSVSADRDSVEVNWGDGSPIQMVARSNGGGRGVVLQNDIKYNEYVATYTYAGRGSYRISMTDPNRNGGILNVNFPQSDAIPFAISTSFTLLNSNFQGTNTTPRLLQPPVDRGCINKVFIHSLNAFDPDGDSLAYRLVVPLQAPGVPVPLYDFPDRIAPGANNQIFLNPLTGEFTWRTPQRAGEYNIAFQIISYRRGIAIDTTYRDMQVAIDNCNNNPPKIETIDKICVIAGQNIQFPVRATDPDAGQRVKLTALGGPFVVTVNRAVFNGFPNFTTPPVVDTFRWQTSCEHIAEHAYNVVFKANDNGFTNDTSGLVDLKTVQIKVVGPPPQDPQVTTQTGQTTISWRRPYVCENAQNRYFYAFSVWRRVGNNAFRIDTCTPGLEGRGYERIIFDTVFQVVNGRYQFVDRTVERGKTYCYRILAHFAKRTTFNEAYNLVASLPSAEVCIQLKRDVSLITKASVEVTDPSVGRVNLQWTKPVVGDLDTVQNPPPYRFVVQRATGITRTNFQNVAGATFTSNTYAGLNDTTWLDNNLNTSQNGYTYRIGFYFKRDSLMGYSEPASTHFLSVASSDRINTLSWQKDVPWANLRYDIFRLNRQTGQFDSIASTTQESYVDRGLVNKTEYCYYLRANGSYGINGVPSPLENLSQRVCGTPIDTVPPCPPVLTVTNNCDTTGKVDISALINALKWSNPKNNCIGSEDLVRYNLFYADTEGGAFQQIATITRLNDTTFSHKNPVNSSVAGCYYVTAQDSIGNVSRRSNVVCMDNCPVYFLPNAFTPNGDGDNEIFKPINQRYISKVEFKVFNRWGGLVFETENPSLDWKGQNLKGEDLSSNTYFFTCKVYEQRVNGVVLGSKVLNGYIELIR
jgi:gliding motility-associated-like protein